MELDSVQTAVTHTEANRLHCRVHRRLLCTERTTRASMPRNPALLVPSVRLDLPLPFTALDGDASARWRALLRPLRDGVFELASFAAFLAFDKARFLRSEARDFGIRLGESGVGAPGLLVISLPVSDLPADRTADAPPPASRFSLLKPKEPIPE